MTAHINIELTKSYRLTDDRLEWLEHKELIERDWKKIDRLGNKITLHQTLAHAPNGRIIETLTIRPSDQEDGPVTQLYLRQYNKQGLQEGLSCMYTASSRKAGTDKAQQILDGCATDGLYLMPVAPYGYRKFFKNGIETHYEKGIDYDFAQYCQDVTDVARAHQKLQDEPYLAADSRNHQVLKLFLNASPVRRIGAIFNPMLACKFL